MDSGDSNFNMICDVSACIHHEEAQSKRVTGFNTAHEGCSEGVGQPTVPAHEEDTDGRERV